jgi:hypothetical protein
MNIKLILLNKDLGLLHQNFKYAEVRLSYRSSTLLEICVLKVEPKRCTCHPVC